MNQAFYTIKRFLSRKTNINSKIRDINKILILDNEWFRRKINDNIINAVNETKKILSMIKNRRWNIIGYVLRHKVVFLHIINCNLILV